MVWYSHLFQNFPQFAVIHTVKGFSESESYSIVYDSLQPQGLCSPWNSPGQNTGVGSLSLLQGSSNPWIEPRSSALQGDSLPTEL